MCMDNCIKRYENKIVLVTGASRGIGAAIAARFAKEGAVVIVNYSGNDEAADRTVENILAANGKAEIGYLIRDPPYHSWIIIGATFATFSGYGILRYSPIVRLSPCEGQFP